MSAFAGSFSRYFVGDRKRTHHRSADATDLIETDLPAFGSQRREIHRLVAEGVNKVISAIEKLIGWLGTAIEKATSLGSAIKDAFKSAWGSGIEGGAPAPALAGARAMGGPVSYGKPYLVGERGPELFVPGASGRIETNDQLRRLTALARRPSPPPSPERVKVVRSTSRITGRLTVRLTRAPWPIRSTPASRSCFFV